MPKYIIKIKDKYFEWSTVVDAPVTYGMTEEELTEHIKDEYGNAGLANLPDRLARVAQKGTSDRMNKNLSELLELNRAGDGETHLTEDEIYAKYANPPNNPSSGAA